MSNTLEGCKNMTPPPQLSPSVTTSDVLRVWWEFEMFILDVSPICMFELDFTQLPKFKDILRLFFSLNVL